MLLDPGVSVRLDRRDTGFERTQVEVTGAGLYRWQGTEAHATQQDIDEWNHALKASAKELDAIRVDLRERIGKEESTVSQEEYVPRIRALFDAYPKLKELATQYRPTSYVCDKGVGPQDCAEEALLRKASDLFWTMYRGASLREVYGSLSRAAEVRQSEPSATGDVVLGHLSYAYRKDKRTGLNQNTAVISPLEFSGHAAARSGMTNIGLSGELVPLRILTGGETNMGRIGSRVTLCMDMTVGEIPTIRQCEHLDAQFAEGQQAVSVTSTTSIRKKVGPVVPFVSFSNQSDWIENQGSAPTINSLNVGIDY
jgi:hypothetical protein